jgi:hypothetical protein
MAEHAATPLSRRFVMAFARPVVVCTLVCLSGCASVSTPDGERLGLGSAEFREYVERVFREQNRVADELAFELDAPGSPRADLAAAETELLAACAGVNELATARRDERRLGMRSSVRAARTVPDCERATRDVEARLARDPE